MGGIRQASDAHEQKRVDAERSEGGSLSGTPYTKTENPNDGFLAVYRVYQGIGKRGGTTEVQGRTSG